MIRRADRLDINTLAAFNIAMALETEGKQLNPEVITRGVGRLMERPEQGFYLIAEKGAQICGSLMITYEWTDWRDGLFWWIQSVYVVPEFRRKGLFRALYEHVLKSATNDPDVRGIRLYVEQANLGAQKTYMAMGMTGTHYRLFEMEFNRSGERMNNETVS